MGTTGAPRRRTRVERGIYRQANGKYAVCVMVDGRARFRTLSAGTLGEARRAAAQEETVGISRHGRIFGQRPTPTLPTAAT